MKPKKENLKTKKITGKHKNKEQNQMMLIQQHMKPNKEHLKTKKIMGKHKNKEQNQMIITQQQLQLGCP